MHMVVRWGFDPEGAPLSKNLRIKSSQVFSCIFAIRQIRPKTPKNALFFADASPLFLHRQNPTSTPHK